MSSNIPTTNKIPLPGYCIAVVDTTQMENVDFRGDDRFDTPQTGMLIKLTEQDKKRVFSEDSKTYESLLGKRISWKKYADADATFYDNDLDTDIVFIQLDKLCGYED